MTPHTPGPWSLNWVGGSAFSHVIRSGNGSGDVAAAYARGSSHDSEANARLISAAPDLLEALQTLVSDIEEDEIGAQKLLNQARSAIAKATQP